MNFYSTTSLVNGEGFPVDNKGLYEHQGDAIWAAIKILKEDSSVRAVQVTDIDQTYCVTFNRHSPEFKSL